MSEEEKKAIEQEFQIALDNIVSKIKGETATAIVCSEQSLILLFRKLMFKLEQEKEKNKKLLKQFLEYSENKEITKIRLYSLYGKVVSND